jgi:Holliday junction resolvasome RuvABC endonuclease subunit
MKNSIRISIDPGIGTTGYAVWSNSDWDKLVKPLQTGILRGSSVNDWQLRAERTAQELFQVINSLQETGTVIRVYCELPADMEGAKARMVSKEGNIIKLSIMVGMIYRVCCELGIPVEFVPVRSWKGQLPKEVVARRIAEKLNVAIDLYPSHSNDAVGIGLYCKGVWIYLNKEN